MTSRNGEEAWAERTEGGGSCSEFRSVLRRFGRCFVVWRADQSLELLSRYQLYLIASDSQFKMSENRQEEQASEQGDSTSEPVQGDNVSSNDRDEAVATEDGSKQSSSTDKQADEPVQPPKKRMKMAARSSTTEPSVSPVPNDPFPYARLRGIRIFAEREIEAQDAEMTKSYWRFWNRTAEELCSDRAYNDWGKRDLKLYIDAAWIIHKTYLQELTERQLGENLTELQEKYGYVEVPPKIKSQDETVTGSLSKVGEILDWTICHMFMFF